MIFEHGKGCSRKACDNVGADYYNYATKGYYCEPCAKRINVENKEDAQRLYGHDLCVRVTEPKQTKEKR